MEEIVCIPYVRCIPFRLYFVALFLCTLNPEDLFFV